MGRKVSGFHPWAAPLPWGWDRGPSEQRLGAEGEAGWSQRARWGEGVLLGREKDSVCADGHDLITQEAATPRRTAEAET